jgi:hypothetical protein
MQLEPHLSGYTADGCHSKGIFKSSRTPPLDLAFSLTRLQYLLARISIYHHPPRSTSAESNSGTTATLVAQKFALAQRITFQTKIHLPSTHLLSVSYTYSPLAGLCSTLRPSTRHER